MYELLVIFLLIVINGLLAMSEIAFVSAKKYRLEEKAKNGNKSAIKALILLEEPGKFLSAVQIGITLVGIFAGAFGGYALAEDITPLIAQVALLRNYAVEISFAVIVTTITYLSLVIGELVPKNIALNNPEGMTLLMAPTLYYITKIFSPVVWFLSFSSKTILSILRIKENKEPPVTEEELKSLLDLGIKHGTFEKEESEIIKKVFNFNDKKISSVMIPRSEIEWIEISLPVNEIINFISLHNFSRYLVCTEGLDNVAGIIESKDFLIKYNNNPDLKIQEVLSEAIFVPGTMYTIDLLDTFKSKKNNIAVVVDEYGGTQGLITLHDIIENIFGEIPEKFDEPVQNFIRREDGSYLVDGLTDIVKVEEFFRIKINSEDYSTLSGFIMHQTGNIPKEGDVFRYDNLKFEVVDMDGNRVDKVMISQETITQ